MFFMNKLVLNRESETDRETLLIGDNDNPTKGTQKLSHLSAPGYVQCGHISQQKFSQSQEFQRLCSIQQIPCPGP